MGTMRLVVEACDQGMPREVGVDRLAELLTDKRNQLWLDISDPESRRFSCCAGCLASTSSLWRM